MNNDCQITTIDNLSTYSCKFNHERNSKIHITLDESLFNKPQRETLAVSVAISKCVIIPDFNKRKNIYPLYQTHQVINIGSEFGEEFRLSISLLALIKDVSTSFFYQKIDTSAYYIRKSINSNFELTLDFSEMQNSED